VRRLETLQIGCGDTHRRERHRQLGERQCFERAAFHAEQLERRADVGHGLGADRLVGDEQRGQLGNLGKRGADRGGVLRGRAGADAGGAQRPGGVLGDACQGLREFECL
jgi:hypothetical protein